MGSAEDLEDSGCMQAFPHSLEDYPKDVILKDGSGVTLRPLCAADQALVNAMLERFSEDDNWFLGEMQNTLGSIDSLIKGMESGRALSIAAILEERIIAVATLVARPGGAKGHIGDVSISVDPDFREKHLATWMLLELINGGLSMGLQILIMRLIKDRDASLVRSMEKLEFLEEAVLRDYVKDMAGNLCDQVIMVKRLRRLWDNIEAARRPM
jgi:hypothetical protein